MKKRLKKILIVIISLVAILAVVGYFMFKPAEVKVLVFSKTEGFRHESIEAGIKAIKKLGAANKTYAVAIAMRMKILG